MMRYGFLHDFGLTNFGLCLVWGSAIACGLIVLLNYQTRPGENPAQLEWWPQDSALLLSNEKPTVVMFTHPHCPCTRSSLSEFEQLTSICGGMAEFRVVAFKPADADEKWLESDIVKKADAIRDVGIYWDSEGREARRFNVKTSGHVVVYDVNGRLIYSGGITGSRGHEGANFGRCQLTAILRQDPHDCSCPGGTLNVPVYGCGLVDGSENQQNAK